MNKILKKELDKVRWVDMPSYDDSTTELTIPKSCGNVVIKDNDSIIIEVFDFILHPSPTFTLATDWNNGIIPKSKYIKCCVSEKRGNMTKFDGVGYDYKNNKDLSDYYFGLWLPNRGFKVLEKLD